MLGVQLLPLEIAPRELLRLDGYSIIAMSCECTTMKDMAFDTSCFYPAYYAPGGGSDCQAPDRSNTILSLHDIFKTIAATFGGILTR